MKNELLLCISLVVTYFLVLIWYRLFGKVGLICWTVLATIYANIEVMLIIDAFSMKQTLGNVMFASTFLVTDILNEIYGKKIANKAVIIGIITSISFIVISQISLLYTSYPGSDTMNNFKALFSSTPRIMVSGLIVYAIVQFFDVYVYYKIWIVTEKIFKSKKRFLWLRNSVSTLLSQLINVVLFTLFAFYGKHNLGTLLNIMVSSYIISIFTSLTDTPILYLARRVTCPDISKSPAT